MTSTNWLVLPAALIAGTVALIGFAWGYGGRAALVRRAILQEQQIAKDLPDGEVKQALRLHAEEETSRYLYRQLGGVRPEDDKRYLRLAFLISGLLFAVSVVGVLLLDEKGHPVLFWLSQVGSILAAYFGLGMLIFATLTMPGTPTRARKAMAAARVERLRAYRRLELNDDDLKRGRTRYPT